MKRVTIISALLVGIALGLSAFTAFPQQTRQGAVESNPQAHLRIQSQEGLRPGDFA